MSFDAPNGLVFSSEIQYTLPRIHKKGEFPKKINREILLLNGGLSSGFQGISIRPELAPSEAERCGTIVAHVTMNA